MSKNEDLRITKTKKALFNSLLELMKIKAFEEITISDICEVALVNRSTFYTHFDDKYELLVALLDNQKSILLNELRKNEEEVNTKEYFMEMLKIIILHAEENRNVYSSILLKNRNGILIDILLDVVKRDIDDRLEKDFNPNNNTIPRSFISRFYLGAILSIGLDWLSENKKYTKEEILLYIDKLIPENI
ncbi:MAG: TetR/AcrR family transcriptional regulator [Ruminococcus sp.]|nr:TetR/AcrR family transcriptional regulator [Ruminococcus sp.]